MTKTEAIEAVTCILLKVHGETRRQPSTIIHHAEAAASIIYFDNGADKYDAVQDATARIIKAGV
jgi:hypothetical protein